MAYIDVPETGNIDLKLDNEKEIVVVNSAATVTLTDEVLTFSIVAGVFTITGTATLGGDLFTDGDQIIIRGSVNAAGTVNNDGLYTIVDANISATAISVLEPVVAGVSAAAAQVDEFDTFILHPTKRTMQICIYVEAGGTPATFEVSFEPGGYWAAKIEKGLPTMQGNGATAKNYLIQVETAPYLQTEEEVLVGTVNRKGTLLMRVFPPASAALTALIGVALVQLA